MAEHGEWISKGASLSDVTATKEYGVTRDFIVQGIRAGKLDYREGAVWGNPYLKVLRRELECEFRANGASPKFYPVRLFPNNLTEHDDGLAHAVDNTLPCGL